MPIVEIRTITSDEYYNLKIQDVRHHVLHDPEYQQIYKIILDGFPNHRTKLPDSCQPYWTARENLSIDNDLIVHGCCLLISPAMHHQVLLIFMNHTKELFAQNNVLA